MNVARRSDGLLPAEQLDALLDLLSRSPGSTSTLCQGLRALRGASPVRTSNTLEFLREIGAADEQEGQWSMIEPLRRATAESRQSQVRTAFVKRYVGQLDSSNVGSAFQTEDNQELWVDSYQLPLRELGYPFMLIALAIAERETLSSRFWRIAPAYAPLFLDALQRINTSRFATGKFGEEQLAEMLAARAAAGREAEDWVVRFERGRIGAHVFADAIRRISEAEVGAGFDILSFNGHQSLIHDRFIEVKSFRDTMQFHWSNGEMEAARGFGVRYWLYLVDRGRLDEPGYTPEMIPDPATYFLDRKPEGWVLEEEGIFFSRAQR